MVVFEDLQRPILTNVPTFFRHPSVGNDNYNSTIRSIDFTYLDSYCKEKPVYQISIIQRVDPSFVCFIH